MPCHVVPVLLKRDPNVAITSIIGPNSEHFAKEIDCFVGTNMEWVEAIALFQNVIFLVAPEDVLDDLLAVEDVDFWVDGVDFWADGVDFWADMVDFWADGVDYWADGVNICADRDHAALLIVHSVLKVLNFF